MAALLLGWLVRTSVVLLVAWLATAALARSSAAARAAVWRGAFVAVLLLPLASAALPPLRWLPAAAPDASATLVVPLESSDIEREAAAAGTRVQPAATPASAPAVPPDHPSHAPASTPRLQPSLPAVLVALWALGALLALTSLARGLWRAGRIVRAARPLPGDALLRVTDAASAPFVWDLRPLARPALLLCAGDEHDPAVLLHERAHLARRDGPTLLLARAVAACAWPTPVVWLALRRLRLETERACDDAVLRGGVRPSDYAAQLVALASPRATLALPTMAAGDVARRVEALLAERSDRRPVSRSTASVVGALALALCGLVASATRAEAAGVGQDQESTADPADAAQARPETLGAGADLRPERIRAWSRAIDTLVDLQSPDGSWHGDVGYKLNHSWRVTAPDVPHVGITGLAVEALVRAGQRPGSGPAGLALERGVDWLLSIQREDGAFRAHGTRLRSHAYALGGLAMVLRLHSREELREAVERGLLYSLEAQGPEGWRFEPRAADADVLETAHQLAAIGIARAALPRTERLESSTAEARERARIFALGLRTRAPVGGYRYQRSEHARVTANTTAAGWLLRCERGQPPQDAFEWNEFETLFHSLMPRLVSGERSSERHFLTWDARLLARRVAVRTHGLVEPLRPEAVDFADALAGDGATHPWRCDEGPGEAYVVAIAAMLQGIP